MKIALYFAALLMFVVGLAHSYLGERYILIRLFRRDDLPKLFGSSVFTVRTIRLAWHITSIAWCGIAVVIVMLAHPPVDTRVLGLVIGLTLLATAVAILVGSRGKHLAWPVFVVIGVIALAAVDI